jgi:hypothetical protein
MKSPSQSYSGSSTRQHTSAYADVCCGMKGMEAPSQLGSGSRRLGGVSESVRACVRVSLAMQSYPTASSPPFGTRLTASVLLLESFFSCFSFFPI